MCWKPMRKAFSFRRETCSLDWPLLGNPKARIVHPLLSLWREHSGFAKATPGINKAESVRPRPHPDRMHPLIH